MRRAGGEALGWLGRCRRAWSHDGWVKPFFFRYRKVLALSLGLGILTAAFSAALMFESGYLIGASAERPVEGVFALLVPLALVQIFGIGKPFLAYLERLSSHDWVLRMTSELRRRLYRVIAGDALFWTSKRRTGDVLGLLDQDIGHVQDLYLRTVFPFAVAWALWFAVAALLGAFTPLFGLGMLLELGVATVLAPLVSVAANGARTMRAKALRSDRYAEVVDGVLGLNDWLCARRGSDLRLRLSDARRELDVLEGRAARFDRWRDFAVQLLLGAASVALLVWAAGRFGAAVGSAGGGDIGRPADWIAAFVLGFFPLFEVFAPLSGAASGAAAHVESIERLNSVEDGGSGPGSEPDALPRNGVCPASTEIVLEGVGFSYRGDRETFGTRSDGEGAEKGGEVLTGVDLRIEPGERLAILGPSGAGKSTLLSVVRGDLVPTRGRALLGGVPVHGLGDDVCRYMCVVQQDPYLFSAKLIDNVRLGSPEADEERVRRALEDVGLGDLLDRLPEGLETRIEEGGTGLSGGERRRVALARALLCDAPVVLFDEPTVGLDPRTESALLATVFHVLEGRTIVMVTHHLAAVEHVDRVVFLERGRIELEGSPRALELTSERYRRLLAFDRGVFVHGA